jgi:uncharacterized protein YndB with AHSA1/START domain
MANKRQVVTQTMDDAEKTGGLGMADDKKQVVTQTVDARPEKVFALVADPTRHADIDGSSMCAGCSTGPITEVGQSFVMDMYREGLGKYQVRNEVTEFEPGRRFAWRTKLETSSPEIEGFRGDMTLGGTTWTYVLEPTGDGKTKVTHIYDWSTLYDERFAAFCPFITPDEMTNTISKIGAAAQA